MKTPYNLAIVTASGVLLTGAALMLYLSPERCKPISAAKTRQLIAYVRERYQIPSETEVSLTEDHVLNDSCTREVALSSPAWKGSRSFFLSADQNYMLTSAADLRVKPKIQIAATAAAQLPFTPLTEGAAVSGEQNAPVTLVEFSDFECPFCKRFADTLSSDVLPQKGRELRVVFHFYPLPFHPWAEQAAEAAYCTSQQSEPAFWKLHDFLFANQKTITRSNVSATIRSFLFMHTSVDHAKFSSCMAGDAPRTAVSNDVALGKKYGVNGTPTTFINGTRLVGARNAEDITRTVDAAASRPVSLVAAISQTAPLSSGAKCPNP